MEKLMDYDDIANLIKYHEGGPHNVYLDSVGIPTCGWGHALHIGSEIPIYIAESFFYLDFKEAIDNYEKFKFNLNTVRKAVVINMLFNLGLNKFCKFERLIAALYDEDYPWAKYEMIDSKWHRQVKSRAIELEYMMLTGERI